MRLFTIKWFFAWGLLLSPCFSSGSGGGPDTFGYTWKDSNEPSGPLFAWEDISGRAGAVLVNGLEDDNSAGPIDIGFDFHFYWADYHDLKLGSNGWLSFENPASINWCFQQMPSAGSSSNLTIAPFLTDLNFNSSYVTMPNPGEMWYWSNLQDSFIVSYLNVPWWKDDDGGNQAPDWGGSNSFQVIFSALDSSITVQYLDLSQELYINRPNCNSDVVVGIENNSGLIGIEAILDEMPEDSLAIKFYFPNQDTFEVRDALPLWSLNEKSKGQLINSNLPINLSTTIRNSGNSPFLGNLEVEHEIVSQFFQPIWSAADTLAGMGVGADSLFNQSYGLGISSAGQYYYNVWVNSPEDQNINNDVLSCELGVVLDTGEVVSLTWCTGGNPDEVLAWPGSIGGDFGGAIYLDYPYYPYRVLSAEIFLIGNDGDPNTPVPVGFKVQLHLPDSLNEPLSPISSELVTPSMALEDDWNLVEFSTQPVIQAGGFYVSWLMGGDGIGLGAETIGPKSRQCFEIIGGAWGPYRFAEGQDLLIRVQIDRVITGAKDSVSSPLAFSVFPNPCGEQLHFSCKLERASEMTWEIRDLRGKIVQNGRGKKAQAGNYREDISLDLSTGMYIFCLKTGAQVSKEKFFVR